MNQEVLFCEKDKSVRYFTDYFILTFSQLPFHLITLSIDPV